MSLAKSGGNLANRVLLKLIWEQEVNSKKEQKIILTKTDLLCKCIPKCIPDITAR